MPTVSKRPAAQNDLDEIWLHIAQDSVDSADRVMDLLEETCRTLSHHPEIGRTREDLALGLRSFPASSWIIFYIPLPFRQGIEVVRVLHGRRDIGSEFRSK